MNEEFTEEDEKKGLTCTQCFAPTYVEPDTNGLDVTAIIALCENWRCARCLDEWEQSQGVKL